MQQPWAWAIVQGGKDVENRTRNIAGEHRGTIAIHAGLRTSPLGWASPLIEAATMDASYFGDDPAPYAARGAVIGVVDLVGVHEERLGCCPPWGERSHDGSRVVHLELERPRVLAVPVPCRGALGLWTLPGGVRDVVLEQLVTVSANDDQTTEETR